MKRYIICLVFCIFCILLGMVLYKKNWFPRPQIKQLKHYFYPAPTVDVPTVDVPTDFIDKILTPYSAGTPLFSDRTYYDSIGDVMLESSYLLQIPRHLTFPVEIEVHRPVKIYRFLTDANDNSVFSDWDLTDIRVNVIGSSCKHTTVVSKVFDRGKLTIANGGPTAASPILIQDLSNIPIKLPVTILNMKHNQSQQ